MSIGFSQDNIVSPLDSALFGSNIRSLGEVGPEEFQIKKQTFE